MSERTLQEQMITGGPHFRNVLNCHYSNQLHTHCGDGALPLKPNRQDPSKMALPAPAALDSTAARALLCLPGPSTAADAPEWIDPPGDCTPRRQGHLRRPRGHGDASQGAPDLRRRLDPLARETSPSLRLGKALELVRLVPVPYRDAAASADRDAGAELGKLGRRLPGIDDRIVQAHRERADRPLATSSADARFDLACRLIEAARAPRVRIAALAGRLAIKSSRPLASQTVHIIREAKTRQTIVAFTTMSALINIDRGERSCGRDAITADAAAEASSSARAVAMTLIGGPSAKHASPTGRRQQPLLAIGSQSRRRVAVRSARVGLEAVRAFHRARQRP
jgi:hypothetical protein